MQLSLFPDLDLPKKITINDDHLESIAKWILEESNTPVDDIQDLLKIYMLHEPLFANIWEHVISKVPNTSKN